MRPAGRNPDVLDITVEELHPLRDLDAWEQLTAESLRKEGATVRETKLNTLDEKVDCVGGDVLREILHAPRIQTLTLECSSSGRLYLSFDGSSKGLQTLYVIISQIHKRS
jgi:hypothetical protein